MLSGIQYYVIVIGGCSMWQVGRFGMWRGRHIRCFETCAAHRKPDKRGYSPGRLSCTARQYHHYHHTATMLMGDSFEASIHQLTHRREAHSRGPLFNRR